MEQTSAAVGFGSSPGCSVCFGGATRGDCVHELPQYVDFGRCSGPGRYVELDSQCPDGTGRGQGHAGRAGAGQGDAAGVISHNFFTQVISAVRPIGPGMTWPFPAVSPLRAPSSPV